MIEQFTTGLWVALAWLTVHAAFFVVRLMFSRDRVNRMLAYCQGVLSLGIFLAILRGGMGLLQAYHPTVILPTQHPFVATLILFCMIAGSLLWFVALGVAFIYHWNALLASWAYRDGRVRIELI